MTAIWPDSLPCASPTTRGCRSLAISTTSTTTAVPARRQHGPLTRCLRASAHSGRPDWTISSSRKTRSISSPATLSSAITTSRRSPGKTRSTISPDRTAGHAISNRPTTTPSASRPRTTGSGCPPRRRLYGCNQSSPGSARATDRPSSPLPSMRTRNTISATQRRSSTPSAIHRPEVYYGESLPTGYSTANWKKATS